MVEMLEFLTCLVIICTAFYCLGVSKGFEDGKRYMKRRIKKARRLDPNYYGDK